LIVRIMLSLRHRQPVVLLAGMLRSHASNRWIFGAAGFPGFLISLQTAAGDGDCECGRDGIARFGAF